MTTDRTVKDGPVKCKWALGAEGNPHTRWRPKREKILNSALEAVGDTPLIRLNKIPQQEGVQCEICVKAEFFNAGGSVKDRIGVRMVEMAEREGRIKPGDTLIEPTSGNTGIGLALAAAIKGYRMVITMPEKMSNEKVNVLKGLGAEIIRTPNSAAFDSPESHIGVANRLVKEIPNAHILDQYTNVNNPMAHYDGTGAEIWEQCEGKVDMVVIGAGTGGTITGVARKLKEMNPRLIVVGLDPEGSILAYPPSLNDPNHSSSYHVEGTGYDFIPTVLDRDPGLVDRWIKTNDNASFSMARRLIKDEGLLCGGSSGSNVAGAIQACKEFALKKGQRCVVILPDSVRNYITKFLSDEWMVTQGFLPKKISRGDDVEAVGKWWSSHVVGDLTLNSPTVVAPDLSVKVAIKIMTTNGFDQLPVTTDNGHVLGIISEGALMSAMASERVKPDDAVSKCLYKEYTEVGLDMPLRQLSKLFDTESFAVVVRKQIRVNSEGDAVSSQVVCGVVARIDMLRYIAAGNSKFSSTNTKAAAAAAATTTTTTTTTDESGK